jgi:mannose-6-phosphate isomerase-like protein (cupin superfamily)
MATIIGADALPHSATARRFEGHEHASGEVDVSFFLVDAPPGGGPGLHTHPYAEVFVIQEGEALFTVGDESVPATAGQIVVVPPGVPHKHVNAGMGRVRHIDIHTRGRMETTWLEE